MDGYTFSVVVWSFLFVMMIYTWIKGKREWSIAFLVGLLYQTPVVMSFHIQALHVIWF